MQETLTRAYDRRADFRPGEALRPWLMSILHNLFVDGVRSHMLRQKHATNLDTGQDYAPANQEDAVRFSETRRAFLALPEEQREALHLVGVDGLTYPEAFRHTR